MSLIRQIQKPVSADDWACKELPCHRCHGIYSYDIEDIADVVVTSKTYFAGTHCPYCKASCAEEIPFNVYDRWLVHMNNKQKNNITTIKNVTPIESKEITPLESLFNLDPVPQPVIYLMLTSLALVAWLLLTGGL